MSGCTYSLAVKGTLHCSYLPITLVRNTATEKAPKNQQTNNLDSLEAMTSQMMKFSGILLFLLEMVKELQKISRKTQKQ